MEDDGIDELEVFLVGHFVGELRVLGQDVSCQVIVAKFTVEEEKVAEGLRQERRVLKQKV